MRLKSKYLILKGQVAEWLKATDCKSVLSRVRRFEPCSAHGLIDKVLFILQIYALLSLHSVNAEVAHLVER